MPSLLTNVCLLCRMSVSSSIQWLLDNDDDPEVDLPLPAGGATTQSDSVAVPIREPGPSQEGTDAGAVGGTSPVSYLVSV